MINLQPKRTAQQSGNWFTRYFQAKARPELQLHPNIALAHAEAEFQRRYSAYARTAELDYLRATEYARLDQQGHVYLDYTGGGLYAESQLRDHLALLNNHVFGNPHSHDLTSLAMTELVEQARDSVLRYFNADPDEYIAIFTANAIGALRLVGESYPFAPDGNFLLTFDNHNLVNGIREFARTSGANVTYIPIEAPDMRVDPEVLADAFEHARPGAHNLFAYPAQSNFTGVQPGMDRVCPRARLGPTRRRCQMPTSCLVAWV